MVKNLPAHAGDARDAGSIPGSGRPSGRGNVNPLQYSCLENPMERGTWWTTVHGEGKSWMLDETELKWGNPLNATPLLHLVLSQWRTHSQFKCHRGGLPWWSVVRSPPASSGDKDPIPGLGGSHRLWGSQSCTKPVHQNYWACAPQPMSCNYWSPQALQSMLLNNRSHCNEKPTHHN